MSEVLPDSFTLGDLTGMALKVAGWIGVGQTPNAQDSQDAWAQLQMMIALWARQRWFIPYLVDLSIVSTGAVFYTVGPGGAIDTGANGDRPNRLEAAYLRQLTQGGQSNPIDYPMVPLESMEDYSRIRLKTLQSFPQYAFFNPTWPLGQFYMWPVPQPSIYELHGIFRSQLPVKIGTLATKFNIPYEYYECMLYNLAVRVRQTKQLPADPVLMLTAKNALNVLRGGNTAISRLAIPADLTRQSQYNIFSDTNY